MKRILLILGMMICMLGMTACGAKEETTPSSEAQSSANAIASQVIDSINNIVLSGLSEQYKEDEVMKGALDSWSATLDDIGEYRGIIDLSMETTDDGTDINVVVEGAERNADVLIAIDSEGYITSISSSAQFTFGEKMAKAAMNTVLGMGTVFIVLIIISVIISCLKVLPVLEKRAAAWRESRNKNTTEKESIAAEENSALENNMLSVEEVEDISDDEELVAVIAAAIAASEGTSADGFVVRSIHRVSGKGWRR